METTEERQQGRKKKQERKEERKEERGKEKRKEERNKQTNQTYCFAAFTNSISQSGTTNSRSFSPKQPNIRSKKPHNWEDSN